MPKRTQPRDHKAEVAATCEYLADWLRLLLSLTALTRLRYGISSVALLQLEMRLASALHLMEAHSLLPSSVELPERRDTDVEKRKYLECLQNCFRQATFEDPLCEGLPDPTNWDAWQLEPTSADRYQRSLEHANKEVETATRSHEYHEMGNDISR